MKNPILIHRTLRIHRLWPASLLAVFVASLAAHAVPIVLDLPDLMLQPNQANQTFTISVQNNAGTGVALNGVELNLIIGDGSGTGPAIEAVSVVTPGTLMFGSNNSGDLGSGDLSGGHGQIFERYTATSSGTVTLAPGTSDLATVTFDTTSVVPGDYSWSAKTSPNGVSYFTDTSGQVFPTLGDGTLTVVPEPVDVALPIFGGLAVLAGGLHRWCRRKASVR